MQKILTLTVIAILLIACVAPTPTESPPTTNSVLTNTPSANLPNPASVYCEEQGNRLEIRTAADGSQSGVCVFPNGSECNEWAYFHGECGQTPPNTAPTSSTQIPTALPINPADYSQGWWMYTHLVYNFTLMLPEDWLVVETTTFDPAINGHTLSLRPRFENETENIRLMFRRAGEEVRLWPSGVGQGEFIQQGTLTIAEHLARRVLLVCPTGEITAIWYHGAEIDQPNILYGDMEFGAIFSISASQCEAGQSLGGKIQRVGEMIIASLKVP